MRTFRNRAGRRTRTERKKANAIKEKVEEINRTRVVYVREDDVKTPEGTERIVGMPVGVKDALAEICKFNGEDTINSDWLSRATRAAALVLFFGNKHQVDALRAKHPHGNLPIEKAKGFATINFHYGDELNLDAICAHESTRRKGVGKDMLSFVETMARMNGKRQVTLDALPPAIPFYIKQGYVGNEDDHFVKEL